MSFKKNKYCIVKKTISKELSKFCKEYLLLKKNVLITYINEKYISTRNNDYGTFADPQTLGAYSIYGDVAMETLLTTVQPIIEKHTDLKLFPTYAYSRIYEKGNDLKKHKDRESCEISATLNLGGDIWPIFIEKDKNKGIFKDGKYIPSNSKGIEINLSPGDMLIYKGDELEHWRNPFNKEMCVQVFLHYNNIQTDKFKSYRFDTRPHLGLPSYFKKHNK